MRFQKRTAWKWKIRPCACTALRAEGTALRAEGKRGGGGVLTELKSGKEIKITGTFILSQINEQ
jgi:hypothetical protein